MTEEVAALMCATQSLNSQTRRKEEEATAVKKRKKKWRGKWNENTIHDEVGIHISSSQYKRWWNLSSS